MDGKPVFQPRTTWLPVLVTLSLMAILGVLVAWQWQVLESSHQNEHARRFALSVDDIEQSIVERMRAYEVVLRGMSGLLVGSDEVSAEEWQRASEQLHLQDRYPGIQALSWSRYVSAAQLPGFLSREHRLGRPDLQVFPPGERASYLIVTYINPLDWRNRRVLGFDLLSESRRREAFEQARDTGEAVLSAPVRLKQETEQDTQLGALLYLPVYRTNLMLDTQKARAAALLGTVVGSFRLHDLLRGILGAKAELYRLELVDSAESGRSLFNGGSIQASRFQLTRQLPVFGRTWHLTVSSTPEYERRVDSKRLTISLWASLLAAVLLACLVGGYFYLREGTLANSRLLAERLREREERFRLVVEASPNAIVLVDSAGRIAMVNRQTELMFGYPRAELLGEPVEMLLPEALRAAHVGMRQGFQKAPEPRQMGGNRELFGQHRDGRSIPLEVGLSPLRSGDDRLVQAVIIDISARKAAEERFRLVVEASPNAIVLVDSEGRIAMVNRQTERMFGHPRAELLGHAVEKLLPESLHKNHAHLRQGFLKAPEPRQMGSNRELFGLHRDGHLIPLEVGLSPLRSGDDTLVQAVIIDISERKAAEQRLREQADQLALANRYKSEFLANMSHELRTPLNSIMILSEQLSQNPTGNLSEKQVKHASIMHRAGGDLLQLINDVLDLAKIEAGRIQLKLEPLNLHDLLTELDASLRPIAELKGLRLLTRLTPAVPALISSDRGRLQQILRNLLSNALKFTESGEVELAIDCAPPRLEGGPETLHILVRDTGIGIAPEQHQQVFQAFQQLDGSTHRRYGGTGLGLAITRQLVEVLDGDIELDSALGQGARFLVRLPVVVVVGEVQKDSYLLPTLDTRSRPMEGKRVLLVDDDIRNIYAMSALLEELGVEVTPAQDGQQALACVSQDAFDLILMDMAMPLMDGYTATGLLKQEHGCDTPIIALTAHAMKGDRERCLAAGADDYLAKPVARQELLDLLNRWLNDVEGPDGTGTT
ncbi:MAG: PAS domain S-box protein [Pseudomonadota bacterium]